MFDHYVGIMDCKLKTIIPPITFQEFKYILLLLFITRAELTIVGVLSRILLEPYHGKAYLWNYSDKLWLDIWGVWDTGWYLVIATSGYSTATAANLNNQANYAFFPLYPFLMRFFSFAIGNVYISGIIISNICLLISCIFIYNLVKLDENKDTALRAVKYMFLFPTAFILSGVFTESLFLALALACFYYARKENWFWVGLLGFFLSLTRSLGVFIFLPMLYEYLKSKPISKDISYLFLIPLGLLLFMIYNYYLTRDLLAFLHIQSAWDRTFNPMMAIMGGVFIFLPMLYKYVRSKPSWKDISYLFLIPLGLLLFMIYNYYLKGDLLASFHIQSAWEVTLANPLNVMIGKLTSDIVIEFQAAFLIFCLMYLTIFYNKLRTSYWFFGMYSLIIPMLSGVGSMSRYALVVFPIFILSAQLTKENYIDEFYTITLALLQGCLMVFWSNGFTLIV